MTGPVLSSSWYRVAELKPRLRSHARMHRHRYRGQVWYLLQDAISSRVHRFTPAARVFIAAMDGQRTVQALWELTGRHLGEQAPTQDEVIGLLGQLHGADLLQSDVTPDVVELFDRGEKQQKSLRARSYLNPMAVRIHLWDPDALLNRLEPLIRRLWSGWGALLWLAVVLPALLLVSPHFQELSNNFSDRVLAVNNLVLLWLVFPVIKALHELGHAMATKRGGGQVHDVGVVLLVLVPVPYVEASASTVFKSKYERAAVGAAGMAVELFIAAIAFYFWLLVEPGTVRALLFNVMVVAGVSTLLFNGNPLLRYDAYYILADLLEAPNLANRSLRYWGYLIERYAFGVRELQPPVDSVSEKAWFLLYGLGSSIYRVLVTVTIAIFIAGEFFVVGVALAIWAIAAMAVFPLAKMLQHLGSSPRLQRHRPRVMAVTAGSAALLVLLLFVVPAPNRTSAEGVLWLPDQAVVRAGQPGFVDSVVVAPGSRVRSGDLLVKAVEPELDAQIVRGDARLAELGAVYNALFLTDRAQAGIAKQQLDGEREALALLRARWERLQVRAGSDGTFVAPRANDMPGRYYREGDPLGYVIDLARPIVRVVVAQESVDQVRQGTDRVSVRFAHRPEAVAVGRIVRLVPAGDEYLPSRALSVEGGGRIATDPRDQKGARTMERMFQLDVEFEDKDTAQRAFFGERLYVRFDHAAEPMGVQWYRAVRLLFLSHFHV